MPITAFELKGFNFVMVFKDDISDLGIADIKKSLQIPADEKVDMFDLEQAHFKAILLSKQKKQISIEGNKLVFADADIVDGNLEGIEHLFKNTETLFKKYAIKAYGLNYDLLATNQSKYECEDIFSENMKNQIKDYIISQFGFKLSFSKEEKKYSISIESIEGKESNIVVHGNIHNDKSVLPDWQAISSEISSGLDFIKSFLQPIFK